MIVFKNQLTILTGLWLFKIKFTINKMKKFHCVTPGWINKLIRLSLKDNLN